LEVTSQQIGGNKCPKVADVRKIMDGGSAAIHPNATWLGRLQILLRPRSGIKQFQRHAGDSVGHGVAVFKRA
jgi:hypothetical protein